VRFERAIQGGTFGVIAGVCNRDRFGMLAGPWLSRTFSNDLAILNDHSSHCRAWRNAAYCLFGKY
jgi:hypothetical protein